MCTASGRAGSEAGRVPGPWRGRWDARSQVRGLASTGVDAAGEQDGAEVSSIERRGAVARRLPRGVRQAVSPSASALGGAGYRPRYPARRRRPTRGGRGPGHVAQVRGADEHLVHLVRPYDADGLPAMRADPRAAELGIFPAALRDCDRARPRGAGHSGQGPASTLRLHAIGDGVLTSPSCREVASEAGHRSRRCCVGLEHRG